MSIMYTNCNNKYMGGCTPPLKIWTSFQLSCGFFLLQIGMSSAIELTILRLHFGPMLQIKGFPSYLPHYFGTYVANWGSPILPVRLLWDVCIQLGSPILPTRLLWDICDQLGVSHPTCQNTLGHVWPIGGLTSYLSEYFGTYVTNWGSHILPTRLLWDMCDQIGVLPSYLPDYFGTCVTNWGSPILPTRLLWDQLGVSHPACQTTLLTVFA